VAERTRIEEFERNGRKFIYVDYSDLRKNEHFIELVAEVEKVVEKYPPQSLYTITNVDKIRFDTTTRELFAEHMAHNKPYVLYGAVIGFDGVIRIMCNTLCALTGRNNLIFAYTKEQAIELLLHRK